MMSELLVQMAGTFGRTAELLARDVSDYGGDLSRAIARLASPEFKDDREKLAVILAQVSMRLRAPRHGALHRLTVLVDPSADWASAVASINVTTFYELETKGSRYPSENKAPYHADLVYVSFEDGTPLKLIESWAKRNSLSWAAPRAFLAASKIENLRQVDMLNESHFRLFTLHPRPMHFGRTPLMTNGWVTEGRIFVSPTQDEKALMDSQSHSNDWFAFEYTPTLPQLLAD